LAFLGVWLLPESPGQASPYYPTLDNVVIHTDMGNGNIQAVLPGAPCLPVMSFTLQSPRQNNSDWSDPLLMRVRLAVSSAPGNAVQIPLGSFSSAAIAVDNVGGGIASQFDESDRIIARAFLRPWTLTDARVIGATQPFADEANPADVAWSWLPLSAFGSYVFDIVGGASVTWEFSFQKNADGTWKAVSHHD